MLAVISLDAAFCVLSRRAMWLPDTEVCQHVLSLCTRTRLFISLLGVSWELVVELKDPSSHQEVS